MTQLREKIEDEEEEDDDRERESRESYGEKRGF